MLVSNVMWVEKYRPKKISDLVNQKEIMGSLNALLKNQSEMPHLLFSGSAGVGKTSAAICLSREILGEHWRDYSLELNASDERGIGMVREKVKKLPEYIDKKMHIDGIKEIENIGGYDINLTKSSNQEKVNTYNHYQVRFLSKNKKKD